MCERTVVTMTPRPNAISDEAGARHYVDVELSVAEHRALLKFKYVDPMQLAQLEAATPIGRAVNTCR